jgi:hypothetical protein
MQCPLTEPETLLEELLQDRPAEPVQRARAFQAFVRAKKVQTPAHLWRVVFCSGGWDNPLREVAGPWTALSESMTAQAVAARWRACGPWGQARRRPMRPLAAVEPLPTGRRLVGIDASRRQAPGAPGTDQRRPRAMAVWALQWLEGFVSDVHTGATRQPCPWAPGDVAVADHGSAPWQGLRAAVQQGAARLVRLPPFRVVRP